MESSKVKCFKWSLKPIVVFMKMLGIRIDVISNDSFFSRLATYLVFSAISTLVIVDGYTAFSHQKKNLFNNSIPIFEVQLELELARARRSGSQIYYYFNSFLDYITFTHYLMPYLVLFVMSISGMFFKLWANLLKIETCFSLDDKFHRKIRKYCYIGFSLFFLV